MDSELTRVIASVIHGSDGRVLICQRPAHKRHGLLWEFPGGKIEEGESPLEAARREILEELGADVTSVGELQFAVQDPGSRFVIEFYPVTIEGVPHCLEHAALEWISAAELVNRPLAPSDRRFAEFLLGDPTASNGAPA